MMLKCGGDENLFEVISLWRSVHRERGKEGEEDKGKPVGMAKDFDSQIAVI